MAARFRRVVVSAPGKLILMGEHAAVYGKPALVAAVDPRARVEVEQADTGVRVELIDLDCVVETTWEEAREQASRCRHSWEAYQRDPSPERFAAIGAGSPGDLARVALGEIALDRDTLEHPALVVRVSSRLPIGSGFGSSASIAVALIGGVMTFIEGEADPERVDRLALQVERRQHGLPSGVDHRTVLFGGVLLAERSGKGVLATAMVEDRARLLERLQVYQTGRPAETTGEVVAAVRRRRDGSPATIDRLLAEMERDVYEFRTQLSRRDGSDVGTIERIRSYEGHLETLGVVPAAVRSVVRKIEAAGGAAKISGAGALTGDAAGCLLVYWPDRRGLDLPTELRAFQRPPVDLGVEGLRVEEKQ